jgi:hypothetical protein
VSIPVPVPVLLPADEIVEELRSMKNCIQTLTMVVEKQQEQIKVNVYKIILALIKPSGI